ncbi:MAG: HlyD family efflux transporter periplasmic adaptor subunit [Paludibacteraceae bacterium]|jgi:HlyD family secretion protein|nr:HlyD family efflux transporter periplasmic adaptor subunit [Paludibacteraceae bacterium]MDD6357025.1 HlyD family efflux transporter periplasmic adaptor subunit [Bacteroidales bacterium]
MKKILAIASAMLILAACGKKEKEFDATGTFEATETTVYAEQSGTLVSWNVVEGKEMAAKEEAGLIDTTQIWLNIKQLEAMKEVYQSQKPDKEKQIAATRRQLDKAEQELRRYRELVAEGAAPSKMLDDADSQVQVLQKQLEAQMSSLNTGTKTLDKQIAAADVQICALNDQLKKCHISAPVGGTVLEKYVEYGEFVATGKPLFKIADINNMFIRAYVTSSQLQHIKLGQTVKVYADYGDGQKKTYDGFVSWISSSSEFTPKTILTDDERADLVYAIRVAVKNDGYIKIGMYGEVKF